MAEAHRFRRIPVVLQSTLADCGAACLTMVLRHHGHRATLREVRDRLGVTRDGTSASALIEVGAQYGLRARARSMAPEALSGLPPVVVHWQFTHFLVLLRWGPGSVEVVDPALGRRRLGAAEFAAGFTGVVILFVPGPDFRAGKGPPRSPWRAQLARRLLHRHRGLWAQVVVASVLLQVLGLGLPAMTELVVDRGARPEGTALLGVLGAGFALAVAGQVVLALLRNTLVASLRLRADKELTTDVVTHLLSLPFRYFVDRGATDLTTRTASVSALRESLTGALVPTLLEAPLALGYIVMVAARDPVLGIALLGVGAVQIGVLLVSGGRIAERAQRELHAQAMSHSYLIEVIKGIETVRTANAEAEVLRRWSDRFAGQLNATTDTGRLASVVDAALSGLQLAGPMLLVWVGAWRVADGDLTLGTMLGLSALASAALVPLGALAASVQRLQAVRAHIERLADIMESEPDAVGDAPIGETLLVGRLEIDGVGFRHSPRSPWVLQDVSFSVQPGQKVALVGRSGSGKSTLARIVLGLHGPTTGSVRCSGRLDPRVMPAQFGVVTQEPALFSGTIGENIALGLPGAGLDDIVDAARRAGIDDEICRMPMGYDTVLSEGQGLSGGQRQRIALARALLGRPPFLVLDEATSHLDSVTEAAVEAMLAQESSTRLVIAHRLSTVRDADLIVVLEGGRVVEQGTHDDLLGRGGAYARLVAHQSSSACEAQDTSLLRTG